MKNNSGLTLMELMTVIAIIAILSTIAVPNIITFRNNMQFNSAVRMVKISIEETRMAAIRANMPARIDFTDGGNSFNMVKWDFIADAFGAPDTVQLPPGMILDDSSFVGDQLRFNGNGMLNNAMGGTLRIENSSNTLCRQIVVANLGSSRIEVCP